MGEPEIRIPPQECEQAVNLLLLADLREFMEWVAEAIEFLPLSPGAARIVDSLIEMQKEARKESEVPPI